MGAAVVDAASVDVDAVSVVVSADVADVSVVSDVAADVADVSADVVSVVGNFSRPADRVVLYAVEVAGDHSEFVCSGNSYGILLSTATQCAPHADAIAMEDVTDHVTDFVTGNWR